jgi:hypothetical protein
MHVSKMDVVKLVTVSPHAFGIVDLKPYIWRRPSIPLACPVRIPRKIDRIHARLNRAQINADDLKRAISETYGDSAWRIWPNIRGFALLRPRDSCPLDGI